MQKADSVILDEAGRSSKNIVLNVFVDKADLPYMPAIDINILPRSGRIQSLSEEAEFENSKSGLTYGSFKLTRAHSGSLGWEKTGPSLFRPVSPNSRHESLRFSLTGQGRGETPDTEPSETPELAKALEKCMVKEASKSHNILSNICGTTAKLMQVAEKHSKNGEEKKQAVIQALHNHFSRLGDGDSRVHVCSVMEKIVPRLIDTIVDIDRCKIDLSHS